MNNIDLKDCLKDILKNTDAFFENNGGSYSYKGFLDNAFSFVMENQLLNDELWARFVSQYRIHSDTDDGWRGEFWGKMMRGACFVYSYSKSEKLYKTLEKTVCDMMNAVQENGSASSYPKDAEFCAWDMWCRKYVLLGMQYFLEVCDDKKLSEKIVDSMCSQLDYIIENIGIGEGKKPITSASTAWRGLNSSSILEPVVRLYVLTGKKSYFDFARYIVDIGGTNVANIFKLAYNDEFLPYQYPVTKAYEMMSCFEGLCEFYRVTGVEWYKEACVKFANRVLETDFTIVGGSGCTHELFDHSTCRQANTTNGSVMLETCVTVTLMKFLFQMHLLTGDVKFADAFEISLYNAYLGAMNTEKVIEPLIIRDHPDWTSEPLPFDSYSPLTSGTRGNGVGGLKVMPDMHYYGCCACIGSAGIGLVPKMHLLTSKNGFVLNLFIDGKVESKTPNGNDVLFETSTNYPAGDTVRVKLALSSLERFSVCVRNPAWSKNTCVTVNGDDVDVCNGYIDINREWSSEDEIVIKLDMRCQVVYPVSYGTDILMTDVVYDGNYIIPKFDREDVLLKKHLALRTGPLMLAQDRRLGYSPDDPISVLVDENGYVAIEYDKNGVTYPCIVGVNVPLKNGKTIKMTDYSSAGKTMNDESKMAVWVLTE